MSARHDGDDGTTGWLRGQLADMARRLRRADEECARLRAELAEAEQHIRAQSEVDRILAMGFSPAANGDTGPIARVPGPRASAHRTPRDRTRTHLRVVKAVAFIAALSGFGLKHGVSRAAARVALAALVTAPAVGVAAGGMHASHPPSAAAGGAAIPGWHTTATPIVPSEAHAAAYTRPRLDARSSRQAPAGVPWYGNPPQPSAQPSPQVPVQVSVQAPGSPQSGPAVLQVSAAGVDLSGGGPATVTLSASGSGWVSWSVTTTGGDLDFSPSHGVLQGGQSVTVTVAVDPAQALDGNLSQTFDVNGQQVTASLPVVVPAVVPSPADSIVPSLPDPLAS